MLPPLLFLFQFHLCSPSSAHALSSPNLRPLDPFVKAQIVPIVHRPLPDSASPSPSPNSPPPLSTPAPPSAHSLFRSRPVLASLIALLVLALILATLLGNLMVCVAIGLVRKLKAQPANLLLISLAVADFCVGLFVMPMAAVYLLEEKWPFGSFLCRFWVTADLTLCTASILNLCMISVDRHLAVTRALRYSAIRTRRRICAYISVVWLGALLVSAAPLALLPFPGTENECQVPQNRFYQIYATIIAFWGPSLIMVIVYFKLWSAAKKMQQQDRMVLRWGVQQRQSGGGTQTVAEANGTMRRGERHNSGGGRPSAGRLMFTLRHPNQQKRIRQKQNPERTQENNGNDSGNSHCPLARTSTTSAIASAIRLPLLGSSSSSAKPPHQHEDKARKTLGVIMSVFIICWVPFFILTLLKSQRLVHHIPRWMDSLALWLGYSNSMLNPLIYCKYNREFRIPFVEMICCRFSTIQDVMRNESYYVKYGSPRSRLAACQQNSGGPSNGIGMRAERSWMTTDQNHDYGEAKNSESLMVKVESAKRNSSPGGSHLTR